MTDGQITRLLEGVRKMFDAGSVSGRAQVYRQYPELLLPASLDVLRQVERQATVQGRSEQAELCSGAIQVLELLQQAAGTLGDPEFADQAMDIDQMLVYLQLGREN